MVGTPTLWALNYSAAEAKERQGPLVKSTLAQHALALQARLFRCAEVSYHGGFINLAAGATSVLRIDPQCWKRTRRVNMHAAPLGQRQEDGSNCGANFGRVDSMDPRVRKETRGKEKREAGVQGQNITQPRSTACLVVLP
jgi:hypothetical protein